MDLLLLLGLLVFFGSIAFSTLYFLPTFIIKWRASSLGLILTYEQARIVTKDRCNTRNFLLDVKEIWFWADVPIELLTHHYIITQDLTNLKNGIILMKQKNREIDFKFLSTLDLAGRNLNAEIARAEVNKWKWTVGDHLVDSDSD